MKTAIIYHRVDWDGYTSAAVALRAFPDADLIGWNYRDRLPDVSKYNRVIVVDLTVYATNPDGSRNFSWMRDNQKKLIWIDHHPIIHDVPGTYSGIQKEGIGACWLTWKYFHDEYGISCNTAHIKYAATFDVFRKDGWLCSWEDAWAYQLFLNKFGPGYTPKTGDCSKERVKQASALLLASEEEIDANLKAGYAREELRANKEAEIFTNHAWRVKIDDYVGWLIESDEQPAMVVKSHSDHGIGDFFILFSKDKKDTDGNYRVSVRVSEFSNFSAKAFAEAHLGGGHVKASGCVLTEKELADIYKSYNNENL
jgi:hypothetical protein